MPSFDEAHNNARNKHITTNTAPRNTGASVQACRIAHALFHLDGMANVVDDDIRINSGFIASCCRVIERELIADANADDPKQYAFEETRQLLNRLRHLHARTTNGPEFSQALEQAHIALVNLLVFF